MATDRDVLDETLGRALSGKGAHVDVEDVCEGVDWKTAGRVPDGSPHSLFQLVNHLAFWQDWAVRWLEGKKPPLPKHAAGSWPGGRSPRTRQEWERTVDRFRRGLTELRRQVREAEPFARRGKTTRLGMLRTIASHNSYHAGQIVMVRHLLGIWPPPSGGLTW